MQASEIIVRRSITAKLEAAFADELIVLPEELKSMLLDDLATALIERMKAIRTMSLVENYPLEASE